MKTCNHCEAKHFNGLLTKVNGSLSVKDGQLVDRTDGKRRKLPKGFNGKNVIVIEEDKLNELIERTWYNVC